MDKKKSIFCDGKACVTKIFIPIQVSQHWICVCINTEKKIIFLYDSLGKDSKVKKSEYFENIQPYLNRYMNLTSNYKWERKDLSLQSECPLQVNGKLIFLFFVLNLFHRQ